MKEIYAYFTMIIATFLYALQPVFLKIIKVSFIYQLMCLCLGLFIPSTLTVLYYNSKLDNDKKFRFLDIIQNKNRMLFGILLTIFYITCTFGFKELPISISLPLFMLFPVLILISNKIINKIEIYGVEIIGSLITIIGIIAVCLSKTKQKISVTTILIMIVGTICLAISYTLLKVEPGRTLLIEDSKKMIDYEEKVDDDFLKANIDLIQTSFIPLIFILLLAIISQNKHLSKVRKYLFNEKFNKFSFIKFSVISIILTYSYNLLYFESYNNLNPVIYAALENLEVVFSLLVGYFILNEKITANKIIGVILIIAGVMINIIYREMKINS